MSLCLSAARKEQGVRHGDCLKRTTREVAALRE
jgi:hypothetical protein